MRFDTRFSIRQYPACNQGLLQQLRRQIAESLKADWRWWVETSEGKIEDLLTSDPPPSTRKNGTR